jgi:hypothetical protein
MEQNDELRHFFNPQTLLKGLLESEGHSQPLSGPIRNSESRPAGKYTVSNLYTVYNHSANHHVIPTPMKRFLSPTGKEHAARLRAVGACESCKEKRRRVNAPHDETYIIRY